MCYLIKEFDRFFDKMTKLVCCKVAFAAEKVLNGLIIGYHVRQQVRELSRCVEVLVCLCIIYYVYECEFSCCFSEGVGLRLEWLLNIVRVIK